MQFGLDYQQALRGSKDVRPGLVSSQSACRISEEQVKRTHTTLLYINLLILFIVVSKQITKAKDTLNIGLSLQNINVQVYPPEICKIT